MIDQGMITYPIMLPSAWLWLINPLLPTIYDGYVRLMAINHFGWLRTLWEIAVNAAIATVKVQKQLKLQNWISMLMISKYLE